MLRKIQTSQSSLELLVGNVVHRQVVHVSLNELKGFIFDHLSGLWIKHGAQLFDLFAAKTFAFLVRLIESLSDDSLDILEALDTLSHAQTEISKPFVIQSNCPVFAQELNGIWDYSIFIAISQLVQVVLMETNKAP